MTLTERVDARMNVAFDRRGSGSPIVLLHGLGCRRQVFDPIVEQLAAHHEVISVDLPGFGASPADPSVEPSPLGYALWLRRFLADLDVDQPHLVGNSLGGGVALEAGRMGIASRVTAFSPIGFWGRLGLIVPQLMLTALQRLSWHAPRAVSRALHLRPLRLVMLALAVGRPSRISLETALEDSAALAHAVSFDQTLRSFDRYAFNSENLGALEHIPVTIAWGTRDVVLLHRTQSRKARRLLPAARHVDLPGAGHLPFSDDPERCADVVLNDQFRGRFRRWLS